MAYNSARLQSAQSMDNEYMSDSWKWSWDHEIPSETGAGREVVDHILLKLREDTWGEDDVFGVHLALEEALVNAIRHGNGQVADKRVRVSCRLSATTFRVDIEDEGVGFNPDDVPDPTADENLEVPSGRGLMLMRSFMSRVEYNDRGNAVRMEKDRTPAD